MQKTQKRENIIVPRKIKAMRLIPHYINSIKERYERCAQIYSKPREIMKRVLLLKNKKIFFLNNEFLIFLKNRGEMERKNLSKKRKRSIFPS